MELLPLEGQKITICSLIAALLVTVYQIIVQLHIFRVDPTKALFSFDTGSILV